MTTSGEVLITISLHIIAGLGDSCFLMIKKKIKASMLCFRFVRNKYFVKDLVILFLFC